MSDNLSYEIAKEAVELYESPETGVISNWDTCVWVVIRNKKIKNHGNAYVETEERLKRYGITADFHNGSWMSSCSWDGCRGCSSCKKINKVLNREFPYDR